MALERTSLCASQAGRRAAVQSARARCTDPARSLVPPQRQPLMRPQGIVADGRRFNKAVRGLARALESACGAVVLASPCAALAGNTYIVNTTGDPGPAGTLSLRQAIALADASDANTVQFAASLANSTITLTTGNLPISHGTSIVGPGPGNLTISGGDASRIFYPSCSYYSDGNVSISGLTLTHGNAGAQDGGAVLSFGCNLLLYEVHISDSQASSGGGIALDRGTISNSVITGCHAAKWGGGIMTTDGGSHQYITRATIASNTAVKGGGGIFLNYVTHGTLMRYTRIEQSTISGNRVTTTAEPQYGGGGIAARHSVALINTSTITANQTYSKGGGVSFDEYSANQSFVTHATVVHNSAFKTNGNGFFAPLGELTVNASIVADNFSIYGLSDLVGNFTLNYSLVQAPGSAFISGGGGSKFGADPNLAPLDDNGGPTKTMLPNPGSPAIDAVKDCYGFDQRGLPCVNAHADMGAVERQNPEVIIFRNGFESG